MGILTLLRKVGILTLRKTILELLLRKVGISFVVQSGNWNKVGSSYIAIYLKSLFLVLFFFFFFFFVCVCVLTLFNSLALIVCVPVSFCAWAGCGIRLYPVPEHCLFIFFF